MKKVFGWIKYKIKDIIKDRYLHYTISYSFLYLCIALIIVSLFSYYNKSFVNYVDAFSQHFITLKYFRSLIINFLQTGNITTFTWNIGFGLDMFANLSYYSFGDIFSYFSILFKESDLLTFYNISLFFRMWLIGITFIIYCRYKKIKGPGVLIGALMYSLSANTFTQGFRNPYMLNASIIFPLLMMGIDRSIIENKNIFFVIIMAVSFLTGFYFAYINSIALILYGIFLTIQTYHKDGIKKIILILIKTLLLAVIGLLLSGIILLPSVIQFLNSSRNNGLTLYEYFNYSYRNLVSSYINTGAYNDNRIGLSTIFLITLPVFIKKRKENYSIFLMIIILIISMFIPILSSFWVGLSYPLNRWVYLICFFLSYVTAFTIKTNFILNNKEIKQIFLFSSIYFIILFIFEVSFNIQVISTIVVLFILILIYSNTPRLNKYFRLTNIIAPIVVALGIGFSFYYYYSPIYGNNITSYINQSNFYDYYDTAYNKIDSFSDAIEYIKEIDNSFYMIGKYPTNLQNYNSSLYYNYNSISYYYSINSSYYASLASDLQNSQYNMSYEIEEFDYRTRITTLLGNKYLITTKSNYVPYGYELIKNMDEENESNTSNTSIYKNKYNLSFGVIYNDYITEEDYESMNETEKEISLLKTTVLDSDTISNLNLKYFSNYKDVINKDYEYLTYTKVNNNDDTNSIKVLDTSSDYISIVTNKQYNKEIYVKISGIKYENLTENEYLNIESSSYNQISIDKYFHSNRWNYRGKDFTIKVSTSGVSKSEYFREENQSPYYYEDDCIYINLGYFESFNGKIKISFGEVGNFSYDSIEVIAVNFDNYENDIKSLNKSNFEIINYSNNTMEAKVNSSGGILQFSTIYSDGWSVYVDGEEVDTFISNKYFLGIYIEEGEHEIKLVYETPYLKEGIKLSKLGIILFIILLVIEIGVFVIKRIKKKHYLLKLNKKSN